MKVHKAAGALPVDVSRVIVVAVTPMGPQLGTDRLVLRRWKAQDVPPYAALCSDGWRSAAWTERSEGHVSSNGRVGQPILPTHREEATLRPRLLVVRLLLELALNLKHHILREFSALQSVIRWVPNLLHGS